MVKAAKLHMIKIAPLKTFTFLNIIGCYTRSHCDLKLFKTLGK